MPDNPLTPKIPCSTYRLQFNKDFRFVDAIKIIPYLNAIGITDIYASPFLMARKGSAHGYDIVQHDKINPEIGSEDEYALMTDELERFGMGQILDIVPNHMGISGSDNIWWLDVLENGPSSVYSDYFDIDWEPVKKDLKNKILIPILGEQYGKVLENGELHLVFENGLFFLNYYDYNLPIRPKTYLPILKHRLNSLEKVISKQDNCFVELLSIITALEHLPEYTDVCLEKMEERHREKGVIKRRLGTLYNDCSEIKAFVDENVRIFNGDRADPRSFDLLDELLSNQVYRLSYWRVATEEINYRRFFDINELAAIKIENPAVLRETHKLIFALIGEGKITGLRIDHPDGLYDPSRYFEYLQQECFIRTNLANVKAGESMGGDVLEKENELAESYKNMLASHSEYRPFYIVGEKILIKGERLPEEWPIFGATGYVFANYLNGVFIDSKNSKVFDKLYERFIQNKTDYQETVYEGKKLIMQVAMSSEVNTLGHYLDRLSEKDRHTRDFTLNSLTTVIEEVIAFFPVYRTYINSYEVNERDIRYIEIAVSKAKRNNPAVNESVFDFIRNVLTHKFPEHFDDNAKGDWLDFTMRFQQITGPVMAKGLEDTAFYIYNRLVSLNEVGGSPDRFGNALEAFHGQNIERSKNWPHAMINTMTHDSKRSEDVRARINVLSEIPELWRERIRTWSRINKKAMLFVEGRQMPDKNDEYLLYQTLMGAWPLRIENKEEYASFKDRIKKYMRKAIREAKINTSWISPNKAYEEAMDGFIEVLMDKKPGNRFLRELEPFQKKVSLYGMYNSLSQTLLKITAPGVPDFYQGTELWNYSLVDPDNRGSVAFDEMGNIINELKALETDGNAKLAEKLLAEKENGKIKMFLTYKALNFRKSNDSLFEKGEYMALEVFGDKSDYICAYARKNSEKVSITIAPRLFTRLIDDPGQNPVGTYVWKDTFISLPFAHEGDEYTDVFTGNKSKTILRDEMRGLLVSDILLNFPVALLHNSSE